MNIPSFAKNDQQQATKSTQAVCDIEIQAWVDCFVRNSVACSTVTCSDELGGLGSMVGASCADAYQESCEAYTCCDACSALGMAAINCAASVDSCPQRCSSARALEDATSSLAGGIVAIAILGSVFFA
jgi:hypothetical protein